MASLFQYRPHVHRDGKIFTPDLLIGHAWARIGKADHPVPIDRLTTETTLQQVGPDAHGVVALVVVGGGAAATQGPLVTVGSLHGAQSSVAGDLLACAKPVSREAWRLTDIAEHLDQIFLRSWHVSGTRSAATEEALRLDPAVLAATPQETLVFHAARAAPQSELAVQGYAAELDDPVLGRTLSLAYTVEILT